MQGLLKRLRTDYSNQYDDSENDNDEPDHDDDDDVSWEIKDYKKKLLPKNNYINLLLNFFIHFNIKMINPMVKFLEEFELSFFLQNYLFKVN